MAPSSHTTPPRSTEEVLRERALKLRLLVYRLERLMFDADERASGLAWLARQEDDQLEADFPERSPEATRSSLIARASELDRTRGWIRECLKEVVPEWEHSDASLASDLVSGHLVADRWVEGLDRNARPIVVPRYRPVPQVAQAKRYDQPGGEAPPWRQPFGKDGWASTKVQPIVLSVVRSASVVEANPVAVN